MRAMKDSGVEWLGEIPDSWGAARLKYVLDEPMKYGATESGVDYDDDLFRYIRITDITADGELKEEGKLSLTYEQAKGYILRDKAILFARSGGTVGKSFIYRSVYGKAAFAGYLISAYANTTKVLPEWILYFTNCSAYWEWVNHSFTQATIQNIGADKYSNMPIPVAPLAVQKVIVSILDAKCAEIDALSADVQSEIETLEAYKRSKVFETIAHGVNHADFQETDSDVWRTIPEEWKLVDIKYLFEIVKRIAGEEGYDILAITQQGLKVKDISSNEGQIASDYSGYQFVYPGDFAMNHMDLLTGWVDLSDKFGVTSPDYRVFRLRDAARFDRKFYKYVMQCCYMCRIFYSLGQGVSNLGRWRLQTSAFNNFKIPVPPYEEQVELGNYLDDIIGEIDDIIAQKQEQLAVLADYRKSVIYEYVTGKKEVPAI